VSLGLGALAKYAMLYFILCAAVAAVVDREARALATRPQTLLALAIAGLVLLPNVYWNFANDFQTLRHTGDNVTGDGLQLQLSAAAGFIGAQFGVAGPIVFAAFLVIQVLALRETADVRDKLMLAFATPPMLLIVLLSFVRSPNANWAATSVPSMT